MEVINRSELPEDYTEMMETESHHTHAVVRVDGVIRWEASAFVKSLLSRMSLNDLCPLLDEIGAGKNSEPYRKLYRDMGYSLSGYWEVFYWELNNEDAHLYKPPPPNGC